MRAERDAFAERLRAVETTASATSQFQVSDLEADLQAARTAEANARAALAEEAENAARQAAAQVDVTSQLRRTQVPPPFHTKTHTHTLTPRYRLQGNAYSMADRSTNNRCFLPALPHALPSAERFPVMGCPVQQLPSFTERSFVQD